MAELEKRIRRVEGAAVDLRTTRPPVSDLLADGRLVRFRAGNQTLYTSGEVGRMNLRELRDRADDYVDPDFSPESGRRTSTDGDRRVEVINPRHRKRIRRTCRKIGRYLAGAEDEDAVELALEGVDLGHRFFVWDPNAGIADRGDWRAAVELTRKAVSGSESQHVGNIRRLLDLGATHGLIPRPDRHCENFQPVPPELAESYNCWRETLAGEVDRLRTGLLGLFEASARLEMNPDEMGPEEWDQLITHLETTWAETDSYSRERTAIRSTYRALRHRSLVDGPDWNPQARRREQGRALFTPAATRAVADLYGREGSREGIKMALKGKDVDWPGFEKLQGIVRGTYGLRRMLLHYTARGRERRQLGLYARGKYPRHQVRRPSTRRPRPWRKGTIKAAMRSLGEVAGWISKHRGVDWNVRDNDLRVLLERDHLEAYYNARDRDDSISPGTLERHFSHLARVASPYLEKVALEEGDEDLANCLLSISRLISAPRTGVEVPESDDGRSWIEELRDQQHESQLSPVERRRRKAETVERVWTDGRRAADFAHLQHWRILEGYLSRLEERYGPLSLQVEALLAGRDRVEGDDGSDFRKLSHTWAERLRDGLLWADQLVVPLRPTTVERLGIEDRKCDARYEEIHGEVPEWKFKTSIRGGVFDPIYTNAEVSDGAYPRLLYKLYVMPRGAREMLLTRLDGTRWRPDPEGDEPEEPFYVHSVHRTEDPRIRTTKQPSIFDRVARRALEHHPDVLNGVTYGDLKTADGLLAAHQFRHALGTILVAHDKVIAAATYLQHSNWNMLRDVYAAVSASHFNVSATLAGIRSRYE